MSLNKIQLTPINCIGHLKAITGHSQGYYRVKLYFGSQAKSYTGFVWVPRANLTALDVMVFNREGYAVLRRPLSVSITILDYIGYKVGTGDYVREVSARIIHLTQSFKGEARIAEQNAWDITVALNVATGAQCETDIRSDDGKIIVGIKSTMQAHRRKTDGTYVKVYSAIYKGQEAILKVCLVLGDAQESRRVSTELKALRIFNEKDCEHTPKLLAYFKKPMPGSIASMEHCVVMTKVPGVNLWDSSLTQKDKLDALAALPKAIRDIHRCGIDNCDRHGGNVIYDASEQKCYIIDFEQAQFHQLPPHWTDDPKKWDLWREVIEVPE